MKNVMRLIGAGACLLAQMSWAGQPVNVNKASAEEIAKALDGVGLSRAAAIVEYRELNGPFQAAADLRNVKGIGESILEKNLDYIVLTEDKGSAKAAH